MENEDILTKEKAEQEDPTRTRVEASGGLPRCLHRFLYLKQSQVKKLPLTDVAVAPVVLSIHFV